METEKKQFTFRGKTIEELKKLDVREFSRFLKSRERRTINRQFHEIEKFINRCNAKISKKKQIKTHDREMIVVPQFVGMRIQIHNGKSFIPIEITGEMLGHRLGEFAPTRGRVQHSKSGVGATKGSKNKSRK